LTPIFTDIADSIREHIRSATFEILINVPWFTDESLFVELVEKAKAGLTVAIGIEDDTINQAASFQHVSITRWGGQLYLNRAQRGLNHEKYCVIDRRIVLFGSYNWTYRAANHNRESILVGEDLQLAQQFCLRFVEMTQMATVHCVVPTAEPVLDEVFGLIDPNVLLKAEIQLLEAEIAQLDAEKSELENRLEYAANQIRIALHDLLLEKLRLEALLAAQRARQTNKAADKQNAQRRQDKAEEANNTFQSLSERQRILERPIDETLLKKLYREACMLAHPDKFMNEPEKQQKATELMARLAEAYRNKDLDLVQHIWQRLHNGLAFGFDWATPRDANLLLQIRESLLTRREALLQEIEGLRQSFTYTLLTRYAKLDDYINQQREQLRNDIAVLQQSLT